MITTAIKTITELFKKETPEVGKNIEKGANELVKVGHTLNSLFGTVITGIGLSDFDALYSWWEKDKVFFLIVLVIMQAPYVMAVYMKAIGKSQVS